MKLNEIMVGGRETQEVWVTMAELKRLHRTRVVVTMYVPKIQDSLLAVITDIPSKPDRHRAKLLAGRLFNVPNVESWDPAIDREGQQKWTASFVYSDLIAPWSKISDKLDPKWGTYRPGSDNIRVVKSGATELTQYRILEVSLSVWAEDSAYRSDFARYGEEDEDDFEEDQ